MKLYSGYRLEAQCVDILDHISKTTGVDHTKTVQKLIMAEGEELAKGDPAVADILVKTPKMYEIEKEKGTGIFQNRKG